MLNLLKQLAARNAALLAVSGVFLAGFQFLICAVVANTNVAGAIAEMMNRVPPFLRAIIEQQFFGGLTAKGLVAFGWNHPIALAIGAAVAIVLASRAIAGEIETGGAEMTLSQPISRAAYFTGHALFAVVSLGVVGILGAAGTRAGEIAFRLQLFEKRDLLLLALNYFLLQLVWLGVTFLFSAFGREGGRVALAGFLLALLSYLLQLTGQIWPDASFLLTYSVYSYYTPHSLLAGDSIGLKSVVVLAGLSAAAFGIAARRFARRDIA